MAWDSKTYKKPSDAELKKSLSDLQYRVTQKEGTEAPYNNAYWDHKEPGIYVDAVSKQPLFSSIDKFDSGTGWPSFTKPLVSQAITTKKDDKLFSVERTEVRSSLSDSHLGHVFTDGPPDRGGMRYCMNSASLLFIPAEELEQKGYGEFARLFPKIKQKKK